MDILAPNSYVSEFTKNTLMQFDWKDGDPIPANLGDTIEKMRERTPVSKKSGVLIDAALMAADDIKEVQAMLVQAKTEFQRQKERAEALAKTANMHPDAAALFSKIVTEEQKQKGDEAVQIVDDRAEPEAAQTQPTSAAPSPVAEVTLPDDGKAAPITEGPIVPAFCPRCTWDMRQKYEVETTESDREAFMVAILGDQRFEKSFSMFNDKYEVTFRTLQAEENKTIHRQLSVDQKNGEFNSDTEWFLRFFEYRLACSVSRVTVEGKPVAELPELDAVRNTVLPVAGDDKEREPLLRMYDYVIKNLLQGEIKRRLVSKHFREFQRIYEALEAMALEPSFW